jgi:MFS family permease
VRRSAAVSRASARPSDSASAGFTWQFLAPVLGGAALNPVNSSMLAVALVPLARGIHVAPARTSVLVAALYLAGAIAQPTAGKLAEELGPRRVLLAGMALMLAGGVIGGCSSGLTGLIVARVLVGVGTSAGNPSAMVQIRRRAQLAGLSSPPRGVLGGLSATSEAALVVGLPVGALIVALAGWRAIFLVNVPMAVVQGAMAIRWLPPDPPFSGRWHPGLVARRNDLAGMVGFGGAIAALLVFLMALPRLEWGALAAAVLLGTALVAYEASLRAPFLDVRLLAANGPLTRTYVRTFGLFLVTYCLLYGFTQWLEAARGLGVTQAGLVMLPMSAVAGIIAVPLARSKRLRGPLLAAAISALAGSVAMAFLSASTPVVAVIAVTAVFGITEGASYVGNQTALYIAAPAAQSGTAAGLFGTATYLGAIASSAITATMFHSGITDHGLREMAFILTGLSLAMVALTLARPVTEPAQAGS